MVVESNLKDLKDQEVFIGGQIAEREFDTEAPDGGMQLPIFTSVDEMTQAMDNRGKGALGEEAEEMAVQRQSVMEAEALRKVDWINDSAD
jgi:hypothetical protein